jgi:hypothetical protein
MKKILLSGIAALLLATGAAHAGYSFSTKWEANVRYCAIFKWVPRDHQSDIPYQRPGLNSNGWSTDDGQMMAIEADEIPDILKAIPEIKKCKAFWQCVVDRDAGKVKHCYENDRRWRFNDKINRRQQTEMVPLPRRDPRKEEDGGARRALRVPLAH